MLIGGITFVSIGIYFILNAGKFEYPIMIRILGAISVFFIGATCYLLIKRLLGKIPGLILNNDGFFDNIGNTSGEFIRWSDVKSVSVKEIDGEKRIMILIKNPEELIAKQVDEAKKNDMQAEYNQYGTPVTLSSSGLRISFEELWETVKKYLQPYL
jgi:hypothetical protein